MIPEKTIQDLAEWAPDPLAEIERLTRERDTARAEVARLGRIAHEKDLSITDYAETLEAAERERDAARAEAVGLATETALHAIGEWQDYAHVLEANLEEARREREQLREGAVFIGGLLGNWQDNFRIAEAERDAATKRAEAAERERDAALADVRALRQLETLRLSALRLIASIPVAEGEGDGIEQRQRWVDEAKAARAETRDARKKALEEAAALCTPIGDAAVDECCWRIAGRIEGAIRDLRWSDMPRALAAKGGPVVTVGAIEHMRVLDGSHRETCRHCGRDSTINHEGPKVCVHCGCPWMDSLQEQAAKGGA